MIVKKKVTISIPFGYDLILAACLAAMERAAVGKGRQRHADKDNQPLHTQEIMTYSSGFRRDQIRKKAKELHRLRTRDQIGEIEDIIVYAAAEWGIVTNNTGITYPQNIDYAEIDVKPSCIEEP
jgi:hypothetical protein